MKSLIILLTLIMILNAAAHAQINKNVILYGYMQPVISGAPPKVSYSEGGQEKTTHRASKYNYFMYLAGPSNLRIYPTEIWLKGKQYGVSYSAVKKTPVQHTNVNIPEFSKPIVLVPETTKTVLQLGTTTATSPKKLAIVKTKAQYNDLVVVYKMGGKFYYATVKKMAMLEPMAMQ